jgi:cytochrome b subunit of formate dehydrogenase
MDHSDAENYPVESAVFGVMSALLINVFLIFSIHTILWGIRAMYEKLKHEGPPHLGNPSGRYFLRFNFYHRITHFLIFTSFMLLAITGLPLKFHHAEWARLLATALGGYEVAGLIHRAMGVVTFGYFGMHLAYVAYIWISGKMKLIDIIWGPRSIVPHPQDGIDIADTIKWFLGLGPKPKYGRFTYWEKFDYLAVFWGVAVIGLSGLVLWFPVFFTKLLPGMVVNLAWIIHADEALLATGFIFLIHFFNTHLRVEKFPLDPVILTGKIDEEEMRHERPVEFALRREDGTLREIETTPPPRWLIVFSRLVGWTFVFIGFALLIVMVSSFFV